MDIDSLEDFFDLVASKYGSLFIFLSELRQKKVKFADNYAFGEIDLIPVGYDSNLKGLKLRISAVNYLEDEYTLDIYFDVNKGEINYELSSLRINDELATIPLDVMKKISLGFIGKLEINRMLLFDDTLDIETYCEWLINRKEEEYESQKKYGKQL